MKKLKFVLLDATPIIKLFELGIWDDFLSKCEVTITRTVVNEAKWASKEFEDICINLDEYESNGLIQIIDLSLSDCSKFFNKFKQQYKVIIDDGEKESLAFLEISDEPWRLCSGDHAVFKVLGLLGKSEQGISLEEILNQIGFTKKLEKQYTKKFREKHTKLGEIDAIQDKGLNKQ